MRVRSESQLAVPCPESLPLLLCGPCLPPEPRSSSLYIFIYITTLADKKGWRLTGCFGSAVLPQRGDERSRLGIGFLEKWASTRRTRGLPAHEFMCQRGTGSRKSRSALKKSGGTKPPFGKNTVFTTPRESTASSTELTEFFWSSLSSEDRAQ